VEAAERRSSGHVIPLVALEPRVGVGGDLRSCYAEF
jgi:hypothetical protein